MAQFDAKEVFNGIFGSYQKITVVKTKEDAAKIWNKLKNDKHFEMAMTNLIYFDFKDSEVGEIFRAKLNDVLWEEKESERKNERNVSEYTGNDR